MNIVDIFTTGVLCHCEHLQKEPPVYFGAWLMGLGFCSPCWGTVLSEDPQPLGQLLLGALF